MKSKQKQKRKRDSEQQLDFLSKQVQLSIVTKASALTTNNLWTKKNQKYEAQFYLEEFGATN